MLDLENVDRATFTPCVGQTFEVVLAEVRPRSFAKTAAPAIRACEL